MSTVKEWLIEINDQEPDSTVIVTRNSNVTVYVLNLILSKTPDIGACIVPTETKTSRSTIQLACNS